MDTAHPPLKASAHVEKLTRIGPDVALLELRPDAGADLRYDAGQYIAIHLPDAQTRCYSMARAWRPGQALQLHVRLHPDGLFSGQLLRGLHEPDAVPGPLLVSGPYGNCTWQAVDAGNAQIVMLATGTGIAPLAALLEQALATGLAIPLTLYWAGATPQDLYLDAPLRSLALEHPNFRFVPVLGNPAHDAAGPGRIQERAAAEHPDLRNGRVYACGSPAMVRDAKQLLIHRCGLKPERFHADPFEFAPRAPMPTSNPARPMRVDLRTGVQRIHLAVAAQGTLMDALRAAGWMQGVCGGQASCGTCRVEVDERWSPRVPAPGRTEQRLLAFLEGGPRDRLACQIHLEPHLEGLAVALPDAPTA